MVLHHFTYMKYWVKIAEHFRTENLKNRNSLHYTTPLALQVVFSCDYFQIVNILICTHSLLGV